MAGAPPSLNAGSRASALPALSALLSSLPVVALIDRAVIGLRAGLAVKIEVTSPEKLGIVERPMFLLA